jgi:peptidoglycan/LPS O-acetylase OafA/YrhL
MGLGAWRFFLAFLVALTHLWADMLPGPSFYAVWAFFVLSGYLMVLVLDTKYGTTGDGLKAYALNRFLRIYPPYLVASCLALASMFALRAWGVNAGFLGLHLPQNLSDWAKAIGMIWFLPREQVPLLVAWALYVEIAAYAVMPFLAVRRHASWLALTLAIAANLDISFAPEHFPSRFKGLAPAMLAFSLGALVYHHRDWLRRLEAPRTSIALWCLHALLWLAVPSWPRTYGLLVSVLLSAWVLISLARIESDAADQWLGALSYPVYLVHMIVGAWFMLLWGQEKSLPFFFASFGATLVLSWVFVVVIDRSVDRLKTPPPARTPTAPAAQTVGGASLYG